MGGEQQRPESPTTTGNLMSRSIDEFVNQLRAFTERALALSGAVPSKLPMPLLPSPPGAMSAAQVGAVAKTVRAQRQSIAAMRAQLDAFDEQLAVFERILDPLEQWSATWAQLEKAVSDVVRPHNRESGRAPEA